MYQTGYTTFSIPQKIEGENLPQSPFGEADGSPEADGSAEGDSTGIKLSVGRSVAGSVGASVGAVLIVGRSVGAMVGFGTLTFVRQVQASEQSSKAVTAVSKTNRSVKGISENFKAFFFGSKAWIETCDWRA